MDPTIGYYWNFSMTVDLRKNWTRIPAFAVGHDGTNRSLLSFAPFLDTTEETCVHPLPQMWVTFLIIEWPCHCTASRITLEVVWISFQQHRLVGNSFPQSKTYTNLRGVLMRWFLKQMYSISYIIISYPCISTALQPILSEPILSLDKSSQMTVTNSTGKILVPNNRFCEETLNAKFTRHHDSHAESTYSQNTAKNHCINICKHI